MRKYNFIIVITFISVWVLFFAQSAYDTSVHAKMKKMTDDHLADVNASSLDINLNVYIRQVSDLIQWQDNRRGLTNGNSAIQFGSMLMEGADGNPFHINTMLSWDVGSTATKTWILGSNMMMPGIGSPGMKTVLRNPAVIRATDGATLSLGNHMMINGMIVGQSVTGMSPDLVPVWWDPDGAGAAPAFQTSWQIISSEGSDTRGLESYGEIAQWIEKIQYDWGAGGGAANQINVNGLYIYGLMQNPDSAVNESNTATWTTRTNAMKLGGTFPTYSLTDGNITGSTAQLYVSADVGSDTAESRPRLAFPQMGSMRAKEFIFGTRNFGPLIVDDQVMYQLQIQFHQL